MLSGMAISKRLEAVARVGIESPAVALPASLVPSDVLATVAMYLLDWDEIGGSLQRLLLWDAGYVLANSTHLARVYTKCGLTMDDIAVSRDEYAQLGCGIADCNGTAQSTDCPDSMVEQAAKCATSGVDVVSSSPFWAEEGENADVPTPQVFRHSPRTFAIHLAAPASDTVSSEGGAETCQGQPRLVIPCTTFPVSGNGAWCAPESTGAVPELLLDLGLKKTQIAGGSAFVVLWIATAVLAMLVMLLSVFVIRKLWCPRHERPGARAAFENVKEHSLTIMDDGVEVDGRESPRHYYSRSIGEYSSSLSIGSFSGVMMQSSCSINFDSSGPPVAVRDPETSYSDVIGTSETMMAFQSNPLVLQKRVPMIDIALTKVICRGATCEVHVGRLTGQTVALKQLLRIKKHEPIEIERFAREIQLSATLVHPHIVQFMGVAWTSFQNIIMVLEHKTGGDLLALLQSSSDRRRNRLSWDGAKLRIAFGIVRGLAYLHSRERLVIHRDIKSRNVLLDGATGDSALCDFGLSCRLDNVELQSADSAGTILWSAPEVIKGHTYSAKGDIYSFGVVMCEIDTCALPYKEQVDANGHPLEAVRIAHLVVANRLKPKLSPSCPGYIRQIALDCLEFDPRKRPTARELVRLFSQCGPKTNSAERRSSMFDPSGTWV
jgi:mitogen-activated protein kinase kinase kinase 7